MSTMHKIHLAVLAAMVIVPAAWAKEPKAVKLNKPIDFPHAGIRLALPAGFSRQQMLNDEFQVMVATRIEGKQASHSLSLSAYPIRTKLTASEVLAELHEPLKNDLAVRYLKIIEETKIRIGGIDGLARRMTYTYRGIKTATISACVIREVKLPDAETAAVRIAYVLTMEVARKHEKALLRTFEAIIRAITLTDLRHPIDLPIDFKGVFLNDFPNGYAIRLPKGWAGGRNVMGIFMGQVDFLLGGVPSPSVQIVSGLVDESMTAKACGGKVIEYNRKRGMKVEVISKAPARLAGGDGFQYVLRKTSPAAPRAKPATQPGGTKPATSGITSSSPPGPVIEVCRLLCVSSEKKGMKRHYAIIVSCHHCRVTQAVDFTGKLVENFSLVPIPGVEPND